MKYRLPDEMHPTRIGERMRLVREAHGLKAADVCALLGVLPTYWSRMERGQRRVTDEVSYLLVERFGITLDFLILGRWETLRFEVAQRMREAEAKQRPTALGPE